MAMKPKHSEEGKTFKALPDGRVLFRSVYTGNSTVVLTQADHDRIKSLTAQELIFSGLLMLPVLPVTVWTLHGRIGVSTGVAIVAVVILLAHLVHLHLKRRQQVILRRAPMSVEQLSGLGRSDHLKRLKLITVGRPVRKHLLVLLVMGCIAGLGLVCGNLVNDPKAPPFVVGLLLTVGSGAGLIALWKDRSSKDSDTSA
jgi:ribose/xylose/arabinose/galactoside ABC-type transport system permease subunit